MRKAALQSGLMVRPPDAGNGADSQYADVMERALRQHRPRRYGADGKAFLLRQPAGSASKIVKIQPYLRSR